MGRLVDAEAEHLVEEVRQLVPQLGARHGRRILDHTAHLVLHRFHLGGDEDVLVRYVTEAADGRFHLLDELTIRLARVFHLPLGVVEDNLSDF